jgi:hypothetical protein
MIPLVRLNKSLRDKIYRPHICALCRALGHKTSSRLSDYPLLGLAEIRTDLLTEVVYGAQKPSLILKSHLGLNNHGLQGQGGNSDLLGEDRAGIT